MIKTYKKHVEFIKIDGDKILEANSIKWVKRINECMEICIKGDGCYVGDTHKLCKVNNPESYERLEKHFQ